jgi:hypothetical protein
MKTNTLVKETLLTDSNPTNTPQSISLELVVKKVCKYLYSSTVNRGLKLLFKSLKALLNAKLKETPLNNASAVFVHNFSII